MEVDINEVIKKMLKEGDPKWAVTVLAEHLTAVSDRLEKLEEKYERMKERLDRDSGKAPQPASGGGGGLSIG